MTGRALLIKLYSLRASRNFKANRFTTHPKNNTTCDTYNARNIKERIIPIYQLATLYALVVKDGIIKESAYGARDTHPFCNDSRPEVPRCAKISIARGTDSILILPVDLAITEMICLS